VLHLFIEEGVLAHAALLCRGGVEIFGSCNYNAVSVTVVTFDVNTFVLVLVASMVVALNHVLGRLELNAVVSSLLVSRVFNAQNFLNRCLEGITHGDVRWLVEVNTIDMASLGFFSSEITGLKDHLTLLVSFC
jgi:hypothetical protein